MIASFVPKSNQDDITFETGKVSAENALETPVEKSKIVIDVSGGVKHPGVYRIGKNARVEEAVVAAGGFSEDADLDWTQHSLNLAAKVTDGMKIYIPRLGEEMQRDKVNKESESSMNVAGASTDSLISINTGSSTELESLPGIGPVTATKIMDHRPYGSIDELLSKKAVGNAMFEKIKELISL